MIELTPLFARRAELLRELAGLEEQLAGALGEALRPSVTPDESLSLDQAAYLLGEPKETFRRRLDYRKALISRPGELRLRYSRAELERIRQDRLTGSANRI